MTTVLKEKNRIKLDDLFCLLLLERLGLHLARRGWGWAGGGTRGGAGGGAGAGRLARPARLVEHGVVRHGRAAALYCSGLMWGQIGRAGRSRADRSQQGRRAPRAPSSTPSSPPVKR